MPLQNLTAGMCAVHGAICWKLKPSTTACGTGAVAEFDCSAFKCRLQHPWSIAALICLWISRRQPSAVRGAGPGVSQQAPVQVRGHSIGKLKDVLRNCSSISGHGDKAVCLSAERCGGTPCLHPFCTGSKCLACFCRLNGPCVCVPIAQAHDVLADPSMYVELSYKRPHQIGAVKPPVRQTGM